MSREPTAADLAVADVEADAYQRDGSYADTMLVIEACRDHLIHVPDDPPLDHGKMGEMLAALDALRRDLSEAQRHLSELLGDTWPGGVLTGDGYEIEPRRSATRTRWQNDALWDALRPLVVTRATVDPATGERVGDEATAVRTVDEVRRLANVSGSTMRTGRLRDDYRLDPDEWCETDYHWVCSVRRTK